MRPDSALQSTRALLFDAGNTLLRMNYPAIALHLRGRGHAAEVEAIEEAELHARVRLDADLARGVSTEGRAAQDGYLAYLLEGLGITDPDEVEAAAAFRRSYNAPAGLFDRAVPEAQAILQRVKAAGLTVGVVSNSNGNAHALLEQGDLYSVDVVGSRAAGLHPILLDPRGYWGPRDCALARDLAEVAHMVLGPDGGRGAGSAHERSTE